MTFKILIQEIEKNLEEIFKKMELPKIEYVVEPAKPNFGDVTCNAPFLLAKHLKKKPFDIAKTILDEYKNYQGKLVAKVEAHPSGYLNFFAKTKEFSSLIISQSVKENYGRVDVGKNSKLTIEHTSVNPNKALHIGHARNVILGDTLARILQFANFEINVLNYIDDSGLQVADIIVGFRILGFSPNSDKKFDQYCGDEVYVKTSERYESDPGLQEKRREILQELEKENSEIANFAQTITKKVLDAQLQTCWRIGASYDCLNFESQIIRSGLWKKIFQKLQDHKLVFLEKEGKNTGCWVIRGQNNEEDKVLVRSNGTATYIAKDIPYAFWKLGLVEDPFFYEKQSIQPDKKTLWQTTLESSSSEKKKFNADKVVTVIDSRQNRLQKIIQDLVSQFGDKNKTYYHLAYEAVTLSPETSKFLGVDTKGKEAQMSGRKGLFVNTDSLLDLLKEKIAGETKTRNPELKEEIINQIAEDVAVGTLRYEMIKQDLDKMITFDIKSSLTLEGDTATYLQYAFARANRIIEKANRPVNFKPSFDLLEDETELSLIKQIGKFDLIIEDAAKNFSPKVIAKFCYDLSVCFNSFYEHVKVLEIGNDALTNERLCLVQSFISTIGVAMRILGIKAPTKM